MSFFFFLIQYVFLFACFLLCKTTKLHSLDFFSNINRTSSSARKKAHSKSASILGDIREIQGIKELLYASMALIQI